MARVINPNQPGRDRQRLLKLVKYALGELTTFFGPEDSDFDWEIAAFIALSLGVVEQTVERTVEPWEKRNYWVKAEQFRQEWAWVSDLRARVYSALENQDGPAFSGCLERLQDKVREVRIPKNARDKYGLVWEGAWEEFNKRKTTR